MNGACAAAVGVSVWERVGVGAGVLLEVGSDTGVFVPVDGMLVDVDGMGEAVFAAVDVMGAGVLWPVAFLELLPIAYRIHKQMQIRIRMMAETTRRVFLFFIFHPLVVVFRQIIKQKSPGHFPGDLQLRKCE
jgi:hypothetical protein